MNSRSIAIRRRPKRTIFVVWFDVVFLNVKAMVVEAKLATGVSLSMSLGVT